MLKKITKEKQKAVLKEDLIIDCENVNASNNNQGKEKKKEKKVEKKEKEKKGKLL